MPQPCARTLELLGVLNVTMVITILASSQQDNMKRDILSHDAPVPKSASEHCRGVKGTHWQMVCVAGDLGRNKGACGHRAFSLSIWHATELNSVAYVTVLSLPILSSPYNLFLCGCLKFLLVEVWIKAECHRICCMSGDPCGGSLTFSFLASEIPPVWVLLLE